MKNKSLACVGVATFCASMAFGAEAHATAYSGSDYTVFNLFGSSLDQDVEADCNSTTYCAGTYDWAAYECIANIGSNQATCSLYFPRAGSYLSPGDNAFCNAYADCSDGSTVYDNQWGGGNCTLTCPSGTYLERVGVLTGVGIAS